LRWITTLPEGSIRLEVAAGRVTLHGQVRRMTEREAAGEAVRQVEGVTDIDNQIDVQ
jgi:osmotically-inducible protein OsmY